MRKIHAMMLILGTAAAATAQSATTTTTFAVTATLAATCSTTATSLAFPAYIPGAGNVASSSTISVKCTKNTPYTVALNAGATTGGTIAQREMGFGTSRLLYNLYTTNAYGTIFGDGTGGSQTMAGTGAGIATTQSISVFGQLPDNATNQAVVAGAYTDTITVTVTY
jgi:spore coat protein U-like protein